MSSPAERRVYGRAIPPKGKRPPFKWPTVTQNRGLPVAKTNAVAVPAVAPRLLNVKEAAHYLGTSVWQMRQQVWSHKIPSLKLGHKILFDRADLDRFVEAQKAARA